MHTFAKSISVHNAKATASFKYNCHSVCYESCRKCCYRLYDVVQVVMIPLWKVLVFVNGGISGVVYIFIYPLVCVFVNYFKNIMGTWEAYVVWKLTACQPDLAGDKGSVCLNWKLELCQIPCRKSLVDLLPLLLTVVKIYFQIKIITVSLNRVP